MKEPMKEGNLNKKLERRIKIFIFPIIVSISIILFSLLSFLMGIEGDSFFIGLLFLLCLLSFSTSLTYIIKGKKIKNNREISEGFNNQNLIMSTVFYSVAGFFFLLFGILFLMK
jgi:hypothetical protein